MSGHWESNPVCKTPSLAYYQYTIARYSPDRSRGDFLFTLSISKCALAQTRTGISNFGGLRPIHWTTRTFLCVSICHTRRAERKRLYNRLKAITLNHANHRINKIFCGTILTNIYVNLIIPEKFVAKFFFQSTT